MCALAGFPEYSLIAFQSAPSAAAGLREIIRILGLVVIVITLAGLVSHFFFSRFIGEKRAPRTAVRPYRKTTTVLHWVIAGVFVLLFTTGGLR